MRKNWANRSGRPISTQSLRIFCFSKPKPKTNSRYRASVRLITRSVVSLRAMVSTILLRARLSSHPRPQIRIRLTDRFSAIKLCEQTTLQTSSTASQTSKVKSMFYSKGSFMTCRLSSLSTTYGSENLTRAPKAILTASRSRLVETSIRLR